MRTIALSNAAEAPIPPRFERFSFCGPFNKDGLESGSGAILKEWEFWSTVPLRRKPRGSLLMEWYFTS